MCACVFVTASGSVLKAVNYNGEMVIIEEVQLFNHSEPVKILRLSTTNVSLRKTFAFDFLLPEATPGVE